MDSPSRSDASAAATAAHKFPENLMHRYKLANAKLVKFQRTMFKRFAPNVAEVAAEFEQLARQMDDDRLAEYAALAWLGAAQCHKALEHRSAEVDALLRSANASERADRTLVALHVLSNDRAHLQNALRCYNQALDAHTAADSIYRVAIIRKIRRLQPHCELTSRFESPALRIRDLHTDAEQLVRTGDFVAALDRRTEIFDDIEERRTHAAYADLLRDNEIARTLLLLWLELPAGRQSPSHVKLLAALRHSDAGDWLPRAVRDSPTHAAARTALLATLRLPDEVQRALSALVRASLDGDRPADVCRAVDALLRLHSLTPGHRLVLGALQSKAERRL